MAEASGAASTVILSSEGRELKPPLSAGQVREPLFICVCV